MRWGRLHNLSNLQTRGRPTMPEAGENHALPASVETLDAIPESLRTIYRETDDGTFIINVDPDSAEATFAAGLKRNRDQILRDKKKVESRLKLFGDVDPDSVQTMQDELASLREELDTLRARSGGKGKGGTAEDDLQAEIAKAKKAITEAKNKELEAKDTEIKERDRIIENLLITQEGTKELAAADAFNTDLLMPHIERMTTVVRDGGKPRAAVLDKDGEERLNASGDPMTIKELVAEMKKDPKYAPAFRGSGSSGSGAASSSRTSGAGGRMIRSHKDFKSDAEKAAWVSEHGFDAWTKLPAE